MTNPFAFPASMAMDFETTTRGATGKTTIKDAVDKDALAKQLATDTFKGLVGKDLTLTRLELTPTSGPTPEEQMFFDYLDCFRLATKHVGSSVTCQNEKCCEAGEPALFHLALPQDALQQREYLPA